MYQRMAIIFLASLFLFSSCRDNCFDSTDFPEITSEGKNTFAFEREDQVWIPCDEFPGLIFAERPIFAYDEMNGELDLFFLKESENGEMDENISIYIESLTEADIATAITEVRFREKKDTTDCGIFFDDPGNPGSLILHRLDTVENIISGTFEMELLNTCNENTSITNGRFDYTYTD